MTPKPSIGMNIYGGIMAGILTLANLAHMIFTIPMAIEQIITGFGYGSDIELGALVIWMLQALIIPVIIASVIFLCLNITKKAYRWLFWTDTILCIILVAQCIITDLFMFL